MALTLGVTIIATLYMGFRNWCHYSKLFVAVALMGNVQNCIHSSGLMANLTQQNHARIT